MYRVFDKLREIATSDLSPVHKIRYTAHLIAKSRCVISRYRLRGGGWIELRQGTTDRKVFDEIFLTRIYAPLAKLSKSGASPVVLIDLGANTGLSAIYLGRVLQPDWIVVVEPDPSNYKMLLRNLSLAGIADRLVAVQAFAGAERGFAKLEDSGNGAWGMRMGEQLANGIPVLPIPDIAALASLPNSKTARVILKCDIEGAERPIFERIHEWEHLTNFVMLELHLELFAEEEFRACIESSGYHWNLHGTIPRDSVLAVLGLERLERKTKRRRATGG